MDEVWLVSVCLTFLAFVIALLSLRKGNNETKAKERNPAPVFASAQPAARFMEMTLEDIEKSLERLGAVLGAESEKQPQPAQHAEPNARSSPASQVKIEPSKQAAPRRHGAGEVKIEPSEQVAPQRHGAGEGLEIMEHPPATSSTRNIMEQIEQAVQETPDHAKERSEYVRVRRAPPAPRLETPPRDEMPQSRSSNSSE
ncbi:uncharacterized protein LOC144604281 isoform X1 [Rhinoraja longicauda]